MERTILGRSGLRMLSKHSGFMLDHADDKGEKLAGTPQAVLARQIHSSTEKESSWCWCVQPMPGIQLSMDILGLHRSLRTADYGLRTTDS
jgi:hypothetical protein